MLTPPVARRMWVLWKMEPDPTRVTGLTSTAATRARTDVAEVERRLAVEVERAPQLACRFDADQPVLVSAGVNLSLEIERASASESLVQACRRVASELASSPIPLDRGPLVRLRWVVSVEGPAIVGLAHRAIMDEVALEALLERLAHEQPVEPPAPITLPDADRNAAVVAYRAKLAGIPPSLDLPTDFARPSVFPPRGSSVHRTLDSTDVSTNALIAAFSFVLGKYARETDMVLGLGVRREGDGVMTAENSVLLRVTLTPNETPRTLTHKVAAGRDDVAPLADVPIETLVEPLGADRDPSRTPLFQARFVDRRQSGSMLDVPTGLVGQDLQLTVLRRPEATTLRLDFACGLFTEDGAARILDQVMLALTRMDQAPDRPLRELSLLADGERKWMGQVLGQVRKYPDQKTIHGMVEAAAAAYPDRGAVTCDGETLSYRELDARSNQLARRLIDSGVRPEQRVVVLMERTVDMIVALLGVLKAGAAYVPIEPKNPADRIQFVIDDARPQLVLTEQDWLQKVEDVAAPKLIYSSEDMASEPSSSPSVEVRPDNLAYVIYTSGSTGRPKGCLVEHRQVARLVPAMDPWFHIGHEDVVTLFHSFAFDFSIYEIWCALARGARLLVVPDRISRSPEDFYRLVADEGVTCLSQTPSAFRNFIRAESVVGRRELALRLVVMGGEALELESLRPWLEAHGDAQPVLINGYGITETCVFTTFRFVTAEDVEQGLGASVIGRPMADSPCFVVDGADNILPVGIPGELIIGGPGVTRGYLERPELNRARFIDDVFSEQPDPDHPKVYRSGDLVRVMANGELDYLGRIDQQVKIRGFRIELGEIESVLRRSGKVTDVAVLPYARSEDEKVLVAYVVSAASEDELRIVVRQDLPDYMVPTYFVFIDHLPMNANGKVDRRALPAPAPAKVQAGRTAPRGSLEEQIADVWKAVLQVPQVSTTQSFFDAGGTSVSVVKIVDMLRARLQQPLEVVSVFQYPTIQSLARHLQEAESSSQLSFTAGEAQDSREPIAIVGMAARFPGANDVAGFWKNLVDNVETTTFWTRDQISPAVEPDLVEDPAYVCARGIVEGADQFDPAFFKMSPREAEMTDPQQRLLLELCWHALEDAGIDLSRPHHRVGVYAGVYTLDYYVKAVLQDQAKLRGFGPFNAMLSNDKDFVATRISHRLGLTGPAISVHTACSTSLVAVGLAIQALRSGQCTVALAGGAAVSTPQEQGYLYQEGAMLSPDGKCRPFDAAGAGTMFSDGAGVVALKRLGDALRDGDHVYAVLRGVGLNNDGSEKMSFTAPSVSGQAEAIAMAQDTAGVDVQTISYVEAHGTATPLGDPIEVSALSQAFRRRSRSAGFCGIGSVKSNFGHTTVAAGVAGLMKAALSLEHELIPASLNFERPNPNIDFESSPFFVVTENRPWPRQAGRPRRAGVSSFGVGGTNAHVVLEEAPERTPPAGCPEERPARLFVLSGRSEASLRTLSHSLADALDEDALAETSRALLERRTPLPLRRTVVATDAEAARRALREPFTPVSARASEPSVVFVFPGQGSQYLQMGRDLCRYDDDTRELFEEASRIIEPVIGERLIDVLHPDPKLEGEALEAAQERLKQTAITQPALYVLELALARLWQRHGIEPAGMLGHSVGEFVAATLAGVFSFEDAVRLVAERGRMMQGVQPGAMLSVRAPTEVLESFVGDGVDLAAANTPSLSVLAGPFAAIEAVEERLTEAEIPCKRLHTSHAFHSAMMDGVVEPFREQVARVGPKVPQAPFHSTVTARPITEEEATDPGYWARHLRAPVRFADAVRSVWTEDPDRVLLEVGPRTVAATMARQCAPDPKRNVAVSSLGADGGPGQEWIPLLEAAGKLWCLGVRLNAEALNPGTAGRALPLPLMPFERRRCWVEPPALRGGPAIEPASPVEGTVAPTAPAPVGAPIAMPNAPGAGPMPHAPGAGPLQADAAEVVRQQLQVVARQIQILSSSGRGGT